MNRRITITILLCLFGLWSAAASADKINPPPVAEINQKSPAQPSKLPPGTLPAETPKMPHADSLDGHTAERTRQLEEDGLQPGPKRGKSGSGAVTSVVSDRVVKTGSKISGGWREYAADKSWRRVVFILDNQAATIIFSDGKPGRRPPSMTHYAKYAKSAKSGPGLKGSPATYYEAHTFADATPAILGKANQSSLIPADVATRIRELGGDIKLMQQVAELKRIGELKSAFDAMRNPAADGGFFPGRPGGSPGEGNWSNPRRGVGRDGRASDDSTATDENGDRVTVHDNGSTTTVRTWGDPGGSFGNSRVERDAKGQVTGGSGEKSNADGSSIETTEWTYNNNTGETSVDRTRTTNGNTKHDSFHHSGGAWGPPPEVRTPSETGGSGGFDETAMAKALPWFMDTNYTNWKRENDLVTSGGRIKQPGRGEQPSLVFNEGPEVGTSGVVNCGDSNTNPCARPAGVTVDTRRSFGTISQPGRGVGQGTPTPGTPTGPRPPIPEPEPQ